MLTLGFIGVGNMGGALARAAAREKNNSLLLTSRGMSRAEALASELGGKAVSKDCILENADYIFIGVKPVALAELLEEMAGTLSRESRRFVLVSMVGGEAIRDIQVRLGGDYPVIRILPNTPVAVGEGMVLYACSPQVTEDEKKTFFHAMENAGRFMEIDEALMDQGSAICGCGPAFADMFMEALADGGVACGLPRKTAMELAAQMLIGAGRLLLDSGEHPGSLKDAVCTPGGTTIQGVRALERGGFRSAVMEAVIAAAE